MKSINYILLGAFFIFLIGTVEASSYNVHLNVLVQKSDSSEPISGASVTMTRQDTGEQFSLGPTNSTGHSTYADTTLSSGNIYTFTITASATGYQTKTYETQISGSQFIFNRYSTLATLGLVSGANGIVEDERLTENTLCETNYTDRGSFNDWTSVKKTLCVKYSQAETFQSGPYVNLSYFEELSGGTRCKQGGTDTASFAANDGIAILFCKSISTITNREEQQYILDAFITSDLSECSASYNAITGPFYDGNNPPQPIYHCAKIRNYVGLSGDCSISAPQWIDDVPNVITEIKGTDSSDPTKLPGEPHVYLSVNGPNECLSKVVFDLYEGGPTTSDPKTLKESFSPSGWANNRVFYKLDSPAWTEKQGPGLNPQSPNYYYFKAKIQGTTQETDYSPKLTITVPDNIECDPNSDGTECEDGKTCVSPGKCSSECATNNDCINSPTYGTGYKCENSLCVSTRSCTFTNLAWIDPKTKNAISSSSTKTGWIDNDYYQNGDPVAMKLESSGCEDKTVILNIKEKGGWLTEDSEVQTLSYQKGTIFLYPEWHPLWALPNLMEGEYLEYYFTASTKDNPNQESAPSGTLKIKKPDKAECEYSVEPEDNECPEGEVCSESKTCIDACEKNSDCTNSLCDTTKGICFECLTDDNCKGNKPFCSEEYKCTECSQNSDCDEKETCNNGACTISCENNDDCDAGVCDTGTKQCVTCLTDDDCTGARKCNKETNTCGNLNDGPILPIILGGLGAALGLMTMGPMGAILGGLGGLIMGGGFGNFSGGILSGLLGKFLFILPNLF
jgi:hypothetical protein